MGINKGGLALMVGFQAFSQLEREGVRQSITREVRSFASITRDNSWDDEKVIFSLWVLTERRQGES